MIANWVDETDVRAALAQRGSLSARDLGRRLGVSEESAVGFIALLASSAHVGGSGVGWWNEAYGDHTVSGSAGPVERRV